MWQHPQLKYNRVVLRDNDNLLTFITEHMGKMDQHDSKVLSPRDVWFIKKVLICPTCTVLLYVDDMDTPRYQSELESPRVRFP